jgi:O-antigen/teichoic acid export membrane protein
LRYKFITNLALLLLLNLLVKPFYILGIDAEVLNRVGEQAYGNYFALLNFSFLFNIVLDVGITNFNTVNIAQNRQLLRKHFSHIISLRLILVVVYLAVTIFSAFFINYNYQQIKLLLLLGFNQILVGFILYFRSNIAALQLFKQDSIISVLDRIILITICSILLWGNFTNSEFRVEWFIYAQTFSYLLAAFVAIIIVLKHTKKVKLVFDKVFSSAIIKKSMPYAILILLMTFYSRIDIILLERLLPDGAKQAGFYAQGYRFYEALTMFSYLFAVLLLPLFSRMIKTQENILPLLNLTCRLLITGSIFISVAFVFYAKEILALRYGSVSPSAVLCFCFMMVSFIANSVTYIYGTLLTAKGSLKLLNCIALAAVALSLVLNFSLIPTYFSKGAALSSMIVQVLMAAIQVIIVVKSFNLKINIILVLKFIFFTFSTLLMAFTVRDIFDNWIQAFSLTIFLGFLLAFIFRLYSVKLFYEIIKYKKE